MKPSAPLGPGRSSEEPEAAEAGFDLRAGMAAEGRYTKLNKLKNFANYHLHIILPL